MANFIERTLEPGEQVIFEGRLHWSFQFRYTFWGILLILIALVLSVYFFAAGEEGEDNTVYYFTSCVIAFIGLGLMGFGYFIRSKTEFAVTNTRFIQKDGIFDIKMTEIPLFKVETVNFYQGLFERIIGTGSIELVGSGGTSHRVDYLQKPMEVRNMITTLMKSSKDSSAHEEA